MNDKKLDLYAPKREILKKKREARRVLLGRDEVDGNSHQRVYSEATKTKRALKVEMFGSRSKASATDGKDTSIETKVQSWLSEAGIDFVPQKAVRWINVDAFIENLNVVIQIHGCYHHGCSKCYPAGPKNNIQRKNIEKDIAANAVIEQQKHNLIEIWEHNINEKPDDTKRWFLSAIESISASPGIRFVVSSADAIPTYPR